MLGVMREILEAEEASMSGVEDFFSVARTMPLAALMPREVTPWFTALRAYSGLSLVGMWVGRRWWWCTYLDQFTTAMMLAIMCI